MSPLILFSKARLERHQECFANHQIISLRHEAGSSDPAARMTFPDIRLVERDEKVRLLFDAARSIVKLFHALLNAKRSQLFEVVILEHAIRDSDSALHRFHDIAHRGAMIDASPE